jgi:hypothetical protein
MRFHESKHRKKSGMTQEPEIQRGRVGRRLFLVRLDAMVTRIVVLLKSPGVR